MMSACARSAHYDYNHLPSGYDWRAVFDTATHAVVFYGTDPLTRDTVYVGPDNQFYIFHHPGTISARDLYHHWTPHNAL
jgi:hypothetical protein